VTAFKHLVSEYVLESSRMFAD